MPVTRVVELLKASQIPTDADTGFSERHIGDVYALWRLLSIRPVFGQVLLCGV